MWLYLASLDDKKRDTQKEKIGVVDIMKALTFLGEKPTKTEVELMIWEVDDDLDGFVSFKEFEKMYKRCINDESSLEPRKLFNLVVFLMFLGIDKDKLEEERKEKREPKKGVTIEDTLQILFVRYGRDKLDEEIEAIFG